MNDLINLSSTLSYHGKVTIKIANSSGEILRQKVYSNAGTKYLARFLCYCIAGNYNTIDSERPFKIGLFHNSASTPSEAKTSGDMTSLVPLYISANKVADISPMLDNNGANIWNYKVTLHFLVPYSYIVLPSNITGINQICLYSKATQYPKSLVDDNKYKNYSATFLLKNEQGEWEPIKLDNTDNSSYNLILDWEMSFDVE